MNIEIPDEYRALYERFEVFVDELQRNYTGGSAMRFDIEKRVISIGAYLSPYYLDETTIIQHQDGSCMTFVNSIHRVFGSSDVPKLLVVWTEHCGIHAFNIDDLNLFDVTHRQN